MAETDEITMRKDALEDENEGLVQRIEEMKCVLCAEQGRACKSRTMSFNSRADSIA